MERHLSYCDIFANWLRKQLKLAENISEYFYYQGLIRGLREGNKLDENKLSSLIAVYETKTRYFDNLLNKDKNND